MAKKVTEASENEPDTFPSEVKPSAGISKRKAILTFFLTIGYMGAGMAYSVLGPSLIDLEIRTSSTTKEISLLFTMRAVGSLLGCLLSGIIFDALNSDFIFVLLYLLGAASITIAPWWYSSLALSFSLFFVGFACASINVGANICCIRIWSPNHASVIIFMAFLKEVAITSLVPIVRIFLMEKDSTSEVGNGVWHLNTTERSTTVQLGDIDKFYNTSSYSKNHRPEDVQVQYAFLVPGVTFFLSSIFHLVELIQNKGPMHLAKRTPNKTQTKTRVKGQVSELSQRKVLLRASIFAVIAFALGCIRDVTSMFLFIFVVKYANWSKADAALLTTVFSGSLCLSPFLFFLILKFSRPPNSLWITDILLFSMTAMLFTSLVRHRYVLWMIVAGLGLGYGPVEGIFFAWVATVMGPSSRWMAFAFGVIYLARIGAGWFLGFLFDEFGPFMFVYFLFANICLFIMAHIAQYIATEKLPCTNVEIKEKETDSFIEIKDREADK